MIDIGTDIVQIKRIEKISTDEKLLQKIFTEREIAYASSKANKVETYAGMFASKEATLKSLKKGLEGCPLTDIELVHEDGIPFIKLYNDIKKETEAKNLSFKVSISHDGDYAIATVVVFNR